MLRWVQYIFEYSPQRILNFQNIHTVHRWHHVFAAVKNITIIDVHIMVDLVVRHFLLGKIMMCLTLAMDIHNLDIHCRISTARITTTECRSRYLNYQSTQRSSGYRDQPEK